MQTSKLLIDFRDDEDFFELLDYWNKLHKVECVSLSKLTFTASEKYGGSGRVRVLGPDPTREGLDPTRPAVFVNIPDPTRPAGRPDPGTTLQYIKYEQPRAQILNALKLLY